MNIKKLLALVVFFVGFSAMGAVYNVDCGSHNYGYNSCSVNRRITHFRLVRQDSRASCQLGRSFGAGHNFIWVNHGCRGMFEVHTRGLGR